MNRIVGFTDFSRRKKYGPKTKDILKRINAQSVYWFDDAVKQLKLKKPFWQATEQLSNDSSDIVIVFFKPSKIKDAVDVLKRWSRKHVVVSDGTYTGILINGTR